MTETLLLIGLILLVAVAVLQLVLLLRNPERQLREDLSTRLHHLTESNENRLNALRETLDRQLLALRQGNEQKLEQMRQTVDEKLQGTLEKRLGESFKLVSERLEAVQRGLGEMQTLATGVGDLKRVLTNVKTRGVWGEVQLAAILEQVLTPEQYLRNVKTRPDSGDNVEFVVRLPGRGDGGEEVWLPIDSKFPKEDYERLVDAAERADVEEVRRASDGLLRVIRNSARDIHDKYLNPPRTTDFGILFLPTEGLYAEVLRQPGLVAELQQNYRVVVAGPTTLAATLNSLRMGFRTLAIEQRSSEVWKILGAVRTEFAKFGEVLEKVQRQLELASSAIEQTGRRTRAMERTLRQVEKLPDEQARDALGLDDVSVSADDR
ncbi:MAG TPA: DNA recombination protein RmuC [Nevskiales bacterium]|nr:DNA recombination protein RmuC [Nevskiales bacterium]